MTGEMVGVDGAPDALGRDEPELVVDAAVPTPAAGTGSLIVAHDAQAELAGYLGEGDA